VGSAGSTIRKTMCQLNAIATFLKPYAQDIGSVIPNMGYAANAYDATGLRRDYTLRSARTS
jgi:hypothetical protein